MTIPLEDQRRFWNEWSKGRETALGEVSLDQAELTEAWMAGRSGLDVLDVGCGGGWLCKRLVRFGNVVGTDLADEVISRARARVPEAQFVAGDFMTLNFSTQFDVITCLEVLSHVADQPGFITKVATLLKPQGQLLLATQNRFVLERNDVPLPAPGQLRRWVDRKTLRALLEPRFTILEITTRTPRGNRGMLRLTNSPKLNSAAATIVPPYLIKRCKERLGLGWTMMARAELR